MIKKSSIVEIQNFVVNPKSQTIKSKSEQQQFLFKYISRKINDKNFQNSNNKKLYFGVIFARREFFPKTPTMNNYRGLWHVTVKDTG